MHPASRILIAFDGSPHALCALRYVARCCPPATHLNLIHILSARPEEVFWQLNVEEEFKRMMKERYDRWEVERRRTAREFLESGKTVLVAAGFAESRVQTTLRPLQCGVARDLVAEASTGYDAVVVGRRGLNRMDSIFLGSVSNKVVQNVQDTPLWIIGGDISSNKVLLAVDGSENAAKAVEYVTRSTLGNAADFTLYHVVRDREPDHGIYPFELEYDLKQHLQNRLDDRLREILGGYRNFMEKAGVGAQRIRCKCKTGSYSRAGDILKEAMEGGYGTIVLGRRGISRVREFLMGRVTTKVLSGAEGFAVWIVP